MTRNIRGFRYELESLLTKNEWDMDAARVELSRLNDELKLLQSKEGSLNQEICSVQAALASGVTGGAKLSPENHQMAYRYLGKLQDRLTQERQKIAITEGRRDEVVRLTQTLSKFGEALEQHKTSALEEFRKELVAKDCKDADDLWLQHLVIGKSND